MPSDARLLLVDNLTVQVLLVAGDVLQAVEQAFVLHSQQQGRVFPVVREQLSGGGIFGIKFGDVQSQSLLGFKAAGFWPGNRSYGRAPHQATIALFDPVTGRPQCLIDGNAITTARTGAAGAVGLRLLARADSTRLTVFGSGVQARSQLDYALHVLPNLRQVGYVTRSRKRDPSFEAAFVDRCDIRCASDPDEAVSHSDVVITATPGGGPLFDQGAVRPGTHLNCVGADTRGKRELPEGVLARARCFVDDHSQARSLGELQWLPDAPCTEVGNLLAGKAQFERGPEDITLFDMTGLALQDLTTAQLVEQRASARGLGTSVSWPW